MRRHSSEVIALSPAEQRRHAVLIAHSFRNCYLAAVTYHDDCHMTVAVVQPVSSRQPTHEIWIDGTGNVTVYRRDSSSLLFHHLSGRMVVVPGLLFAALAVLLFAVYL
ncbi:MAG: hypothetical protein EHM39_02670 [Chloroflexi bacterium]|nr:MAG: hypothetical protein EHM39_02670 [Chloroflexota bacterium]